MDERRIVRRISAASVTAAFIYVAAGLTAAALGRSSWHMALLLYGGLLLFPHGVALSYISSATARGTPLRLTLLSGIVSAPLMLAPLVYGLSPRVADALVLAASITAIPASLAAASARKGSVRTSLTMVAATYMGLSFLVALQLLDRAGGSLPLEALSVALSYDVPLIISVTTHSFPKTLGFKAFEPLLWASLLLSVAAALSVHTAGLRVSSILLMTSLLLYIPGAGLHRYRSLLARINERPGPRSPAYAGLKYFLDGHLYVVLVSLVTIAYIVAWLPYTCPGACLLGLLHMVALGFSLMHVAIHAPMLIPVILGVKHAKRYSQAPYILLLASTLLWPLSGDASLVLTALGVAAMVAVFLPIPGSSKR